MRASLSSRPRRWTPLIQLRTDRSLTRSMAAISLTFSTDGASLVSPAAACFVGLFIPDLLPRPSAGRPRAPPAAAALVRLDDAVQGVRHGQRLGEQDAQLALVLQPLGAAHVVLLCEGGPGAGRGGGRRAASGGRGADQAGGQRGECVSAVHRWVS